MGVTTKRAKLSHKPSKATLSVTMKAGLGRSLHKTKANLNKQRYRKDLTKAAMKGQLPSSGHRSLCQRGKAPRLRRPRRNKKKEISGILGVCKLIVLPGTFSGIIDTFRC